jgi:hypothetical protein
VLLHPPPRRVGSPRRPPRRSADDVALDDLLRGNARRRQRELHPRFDDELGQLGVSLPIATLVVRGAHGPVDAPPSPGDRVRARVHLETPGPGLEPLGALHENAKVVARNRACRKRWRKRLLGGIRYASDLVGWAGFEPATSASRTQGAGVFHRLITRRFPSSVRITVCRPVPSYVVR